MILASHIGYNAMVILAETIETIPLEKRIDSHDYDYQGMAVENLQFLGMVLGFLILLLYVGLIFIGGLLALVRHRRKARDRQYIETSILTEKPTHLQNNPPNPNNPKTNPPNPNPPNPNHPTTIQPPTGPEPPYNNPTPIERRT